ncbi:MAG: VWA domain-containing protein [Solirubrobacteraceae bacterium]|nr:VWA domain-containing protein [Solirubrobacteraceae bacterium]
MTLKDPIFLLTLLLIPLGIAAARLARSRRRRFAVRLPTAGMAARLVGREPAWRRLVAPIFTAASVLAISVALSRPEVTVAVPVERASVMLVTDASGSMRAEDVSPTRLDAAKNAVGEFLDQAPEQMRVGLLSYSSSVEGVENPTTDRQQIRDAISSIDAGGGTATGDALAAAIEALRPANESKNPAPAAILLLSDGMTSGGVDPIGVAREAKAKGISISTVALGTPDGTVQLAPGQWPMRVPPDPETLRAIAEVSGGEAFTADDASKLSDVYKQMSSKLGTRPEQREVSAGFAGLAAVLLMAGTAAALRRRGRVAL